MLFGIKLAWFILSLTGLLACTLVLTAFSRTTGMRWGPALYTLGNVFLQGSFCLGMIYKMDPYRMPKSFCVAQTVLISFGAFIIGGVTIAFTIATYLTSMKPKTWGDSYIRLMQWKPIYWAIILAFPVCASAAHLIVILKLDSAQPSDDMHCDSTDPEWVRFVGYAGLPFITAWPSLYFSLKSVLHIRKMNLHIQRARPESSAQALSNFLPRALRKTRPNGASDGTPSWNAASGFASATPRVVTKRESVTPSIVRPQSGTQASLQYTVPPFVQSPPSAPHGNSSAPPSSYSPPDADNEFDDTNSRVSLTFPTFTNPDNSKEPPVLTVKTPAPEEVEDNRESESNYDHTWNEDKLELKSMSETMDALDGRYRRPSAALPTKTGRPIPILKPALWQIILFQISFMCIQILACVSTIIDVATSRATPTPMGTQHIALLLAGWGPVVVFGHLRVVRRNLRFWRPVVT